MSKKVFGYSERDGRDWFGSELYNDTIIERIADPEGGSAISLPTAIPSPFARMDLVRIAFQNINRTADLRMFEVNGDVIAGAEDERLVSHTLDLLEIFYNYGLFAGQLKIIPWNLNVELANLKGNAEQSDYGDALKLYIDQDQAAYNFDLATDLYIIKYNFQVIGCTSAVTFFCPTANNLSAVNITVGQRLLFKTLQPLYLRDAKFQQFVYYIFKRYPLLGSRMRAFDTYIAESKRKLGSLDDHKAKALFNRINQIEDNYHLADLEFTTIRVTTLANAPINIFNAPNNIVPLMMLNMEIEGQQVEANRRRQAQELRQLARKSGFTIDSARFSGEDRPLVLTNDLDRPIRYMGSPWNNDNKVPNAYAEPVDNRQLPGYELTYPHLVISDFLEPTLIRVVYPISDRFFNGNFRIEFGPEINGYLLPLKLAFFDYFTAEDLLSGGNGKPKISIEQNIAGSVAVTLSIPITGNEYITYSRVYYYDLKNAPNTLEIEKSNRGLVVEHQAGLTIFPFIRTKNPDLQAFYRVQLVDRDMEGELAASDYDLTFFTDTNGRHIIVPGDQKKRSVKSMNQVATKYYILNKEFDFIQLKSAVSTAIIIPNWQPFHQGNTSYDFAIDFGTTNTHIEYRTSQNPNPVPFDIATDQEVQIATLFDPYKTSQDFGGSGAIAIRECINEEFVPFKIGKPNSVFKFPQRTVLAKNDTIVGNQTETLADYNIPFMFEKNSFAYNSKFETDLKWSRYNPENFNKIRAYFEELIFLIRNKVLLNGGRLQQTSIIWFYPTSMQTSRIDNLSQLWQQTIDKYMPEGVVVTSMPESLAPFYYYKFSNIIPGGNFTPAVSIDIGGGTSDVVIFKSNNPLYLTSFKFAANTLFGDAFHSIRKEGRGILGKHLPHFRRELDAGRYTPLNQALKQVISNDKSTDINAFLFSLEDNPDIKDKDLFSYDLLLNNDEDLKIVFLYFYSAIIYHVASWMKACGVELPNHIFLSGTGSKVLKIMSFNLSRIEQLTTRLFEKVYETKIAMPLKLITDLKIPKEATCKGGLLSRNQAVDVDIPNIKRVLNYDDQGPTISRIKYSELSTPVKESVIKDIKKFNDLFIGLNDHGLFFDDFTVSPAAFNYFKAHINEDLNDFLADGIDFNLSLDMDEGQEKNLEESLFFLPLTGVIYNMNASLAVLNPANP